LTNKKANQKRSSEKPGPVRPAQQDTKPLHGPHPAILQLGNPVLRSPAILVKDFDSQLKKLAEQMIEIMQQASGVGLAAQQIGSIRRICIIPGQEDKPLVLVNPTLKNLDGGNQPAIEGCLSLYGLQLPVERQLAVQVQAQDLSGQEIEFKAEGLQARAVQHEIDHLNGILIIDRVSPQLRWMALKQLIQS